MYKYLALAVLLLISLEAEIKTFAKGKYLYTTETFDSGPFDEKDLTV